MDVAVFVHFNDNVVSADVGNEIWTSARASAFHLLIAYPFQFRKGANDVLPDCVLFCLVVVNDRDVRMLMNDTPKAVAAIFRIAGHIAHFRLAESTASALIASHFGSFVSAIVVVAAFVAVNFWDFVLAMCPASVCVVKMDVEAVDVFGLEGA